MESELSVRFVVSGRVQGVGYRFFVHQAATELGLRGWVRNRRDSSVEVAVLGSPKALDALQRRLEAGPRAATVETVRREPQPMPDRALQAYNSFEIVVEGDD